MNTPTRITLAGYIWHYNVINPTSHLLDSATHKELVSLPPEDFIPADGEAPPPTVYNLLLREHFTIAVCNGETFRTDDDLGKAMIRYEQQPTDKHREIYRLIRDKGLTFGAATYAAEAPERRARYERKIAWLTLQTSEPNALTPQLAEKFYFAGPFAQEINWREVIACISFAPAHWHDRIIHAIRGRKRDVMEPLVGELFEGNNMIGKSCSAHRMQLWCDYILTHYYMEEIS